MADGDTTLKMELTLSGPALRHLKARAEKLGQTLDAAAAEVVELYLFDYADWDWGENPEDDPRHPQFETFDPNEPTVSLEEALTIFEADLEKRLAAKR